jgi:amphi-Trp domain-containing protein
MAEVEFERKLRVSREQAGERLVTLGRSLMGGARSKLEHEGDSIHFTVADELDWEFELNIDGDEVELELELKWSNRKRSTRAARSAPTAAAPSAAGGEATVATKPRAASKRAKSARKAAS